MTRVTALAEDGSTTLKRVFVRASVLLLVLAALFTMNASVAEAQNTPRVQVSEPTLTTQATVRVVGVLADKKFDELMRNG
ncbi:MAG: hypothetical protein H7Z40_01030, partial [Phycisphaerae bacterium]|nr:hypothetical protein [Gemmatimonadaceae bacterium]